MYREEPDKDRLLCPYFFFRRGSFLHLRLVQIDNDYEIISSNTNKTTYGMPMQRIKSIRMTSYGSRRLSHEVDLATAYQQLPP